MKLSSNKDVIIDTLASIEAAQEQLIRFDEMLSYIRGHNRYTELSTGNIRETIYGIEINQWRRLLMWAITLTDEERDRIKAAVHHRFLRKDQSIIDWINGGISPSFWYTAEEVEFRELVEKTFAPSAAKPEK